jgi:hypothetical protein
MKAPLVGKEKRKATKYRTDGYKRVGHVEHGPATHPQKIGYLPGHDTVDEIACKSRKDEQETMGQASVSVVQCGDSRYTDGNAKHGVHRNNPLPSSKESKRDPLVHCQDKPHRACREGVLEKKTPCHPFGALIFQDQQDNRNRPVEKSAWSVHRVPSTIALPSRPISTILLLEACPRTIRTAERATPKC